MCNIYYAICIICIIYEYNIKQVLTEERSSMHQSKLSLSSRVLLPASCTYIIAILITITILTGLILSSVTTSATDDSIVDEVNITVPISCSLSGTGMNTHNANIVNGTYQADIGTTTLKAFCNDNAGFAIYAAGYTGNEIGGTNSNKLVGTTSSSNATIDTGTATSAGNPDTSNWAMKLTATSDSGDTSGTNALAIDSDTEGSFSAYHTVPNSYTKVAHKNSATNMDTTTGGTTLTTTYAAYISKTQAADTYSGQVIYTLVHPSDAEAPLSPQPSTAGYITYYANASSAVGTMANQSAGNNATVTLYPSNFSRSGYGFAGWSDKYDYATNQNAHFYGPNEDFTTPSDLTTKGLSLYAVWVKSEGSLQDSTKVTSLCGTNGTGGTLTKAPTDGTANLSSVSALTDQRDNQTYAIARLADGNCWMIENLRLENTATTGATNTALAQGYNSSFTGLANPESAGFTDSTTANSLYSIDGSTENNISGDYQGYRFPRYNNFNTQQRAENTSNTNVNTYSYGNYYTWAAAIADTTHYNTNNQSVTNTSICPTGWRLPQGNTTTSGFGKLDADMGGTGAYQSTREASNRWRKYPNNFLYSGYFNTSSAKFRGSDGSYWSSTANYNFGSYGPYLFSSGVYPGTSNNVKNYGQSIRCTAIGS